MLPRFTEVRRTRPVDLVVPGSTMDEVVAPYAALAGPGQLTLESGDDRVVAQYDGRAVWLEVTTEGRTTQHRSRRHGRPGAPVDEVGLALTGTHVTALTRHDGSWVGRARVDLQHRIDTRDETWLSRLTADAPTAGRFGQLGLRDIRAASNADGTPYVVDGRVVLTATSAGPGFFDTAHTSVWALDPDALSLQHLADLFFRRPDAPGAYGDHATHLVRDGHRWLVATSTWGDFDRRRPGASVAVTLAETSADLLSGSHLLDTRPLPLPTDGLRSVGVWDPHLVRTDLGSGPVWLVGFVSAPAFFTFHPALASGPSLDALTLRSAATERTATEGTTLLRLDEDWRVLASDGPDSPRRLRRRYPVLDLDLRETATVAAPYPTNIPWPTLIPQGDSWLLVGFDGTPYGGKIAGYGTHGEVVFMRPESRTTV